MAYHALIPVLTYIRSSLRKRRTVHGLIAEGALDPVGYSVSHTPRPDVNQGVTEWKMITSVPEYEASIAIFHQSLPFLLPTFPNIQPVVPYTRWSRFLSATVDAVAIYKTLAQ